jgi:hypothetical protein
MAFQLTHGASKPDRTDHGMESRQWLSAVFSALSPVHRCIESLQMQKDTETATLHSISSVLAALHNFARQLSVGLISLHKHFPDKFPTDLQHTHLAVELPKTA